MFTGLTNGTMLTFTVQCFNGVLWGDTSAPSNPATPAGIPSAPARVVATPGDGQAQVRWDPPEDINGDAVHTCVALGEGGTFEHAVVVCVRVLVLLLVLLLALLFVDWFVCLCCVVLWWFVLWCMFPPPFALSFLVVTLVAVFAPPPAPLRVVRAC